MTGKIYNNFSGTIKVKGVTRNLNSKFSPDGKRTDYFFDTELGVAVFYGVIGKNQAFIDAIEKALANENSGEFSNCCYAVSDAGKLYIEASPYFKVINSSEKTIA